MAGVDLVKLGAGRYVTVDGRFMVEADESPGSKAWWLDDRRATGPVLVGSLRDAAKRIVEARSGSGSTPPAGADTPPAAGGVVPGAETRPGEVSPPLSPPPSDGGGLTPGGAARMAHPSHRSTGCVLGDPVEYRRVSARIVDDTILLVAANEPATLPVFHERLFELARCGDPRRVAGVLSSLSTIARSLAESPHPDSPDVTAVLADYRSRFERVYTAAADRMEGRSR